uniref:Uncharacterized protein n=1 Tax=Timema bartmani TaxID=61472 RepID=A0A7R9FBC8_9NEOP|nr:unnamed protein product [Timema bartmani]
MRRKQPQNMSTKNLETINIPFKDSDHSSIITGIGEANLTSIVEKISNAGRINFTMLSKTPRPDSDSSHRYKEAFYQKNGSFYYIHGQFSQK